MKPFPLAFAALAVLVLVRRWRRLEPESKAVLALLAIGLAVYGTGAVHIPNVEKLLEDVGTHLGSWTYLLVGAMAFAETGAFLGFVAPGEVTVLVGGLVAGQGKIDVIALLAIVWACAVAGDLTSYALGRRLGREFLVRHGARVKITEERLAQVEAFFERRGGVTIVVGRFLGLVRPIAPFLAGSSRMPLRRFLPYDVVAAGAWSTTFVLLGYVFWHSFDQVVEVAKKGAFGLGAAAAAIVAIVVAYRQLREPENRARLLEHLERLPGWSRFVAPAGRALAGPARFVYDRLTPGDLGLELTTLLAVAAVGSFAFVGYAIVLGGVAHTPGDLRVLAWSHDLQAGWAVDVAKVVTWLGSLAVAIALTVAGAAWLVARRRRLEAGVLAAGLALTYVAVHVAKAISDRPRPADALVGADGSSWPSGHAAYSAVLVALAATIARTSGWARATALVAVAAALAVVVGATRLYLRAHFLSDVLAGYGLGATIFALCAICALIADFLRHNMKASS
ncbi:MAG TPA: bifunctional DedA family/phosphatase PAP2 family protein [Solirubrobacteraceae bacterium]|jgi:undecaprenyl-diphosphatase|nr:bifunctional DedA family/phosphatase PAP2 family protein [Solirubrobacteraceae bacterium]